MIAAQHDAQEGDTVTTEQTEQAPASGMNLAAIVAAGNAEALRDYWTRGEGGQLIRWGEDGSFGRCVRRVSKYMTRDQAQGFCAERHHDATGEWPAEEGVPS